MRVRALVFVAVLAMISVGVFAGDSSSGRENGGDTTTTDQLLEAGWVKKAEGVFERTDDAGVLHRKSIGLDGLRNDIERLEGILELTADFSRDLSAEKRQEKLNSVREQLRYLYRIVDLRSISSSVSEKVQCTPSVRATYVSDLPYGGAFIGLLANTIFDGTNCPGMWGYGSVYAYARGGIPTEVNSDVSDPFDNDFNLYVAALNIWAPDHCEYAYSVLFWTDGVSNSGYQSVSEEYPEGCF